MATRLDFLRVRWGAKCGALKREMLRGVFRADVGDLRHIDKVRQAARMSSVNRRAFLKKAAVAAAGTMLAGCNDNLLNLFNTGTEQLWGMNVHPFSGEIGSAQIEVLRLLGIRRIRMTLGLEDDLAGPYLQGYSGAEYVGLVNDYSTTIPAAAAWPGLVRRAVERAPGLYCYEILNEPTDLTPAVYVEQYLRPAYEIIKGINPSYQVAAAAPSGTSGGRLYFYQMTDAGADSWCDVRAAHVYGETADLYLAGTTKPFLITETGISDPASHVDWWSNTMTHTSAVLETDRLYFYDLADSGDSGFALISMNSRPGAIVALSPLYEYIRTRYGT